MEINCMFNTISLVISCIISVNELSDEESKFNPTCRLDQYFFPHANSLSFATETVLLLFLLFKICSYSLFD